jgi:hypothetical protein
MELDTLDGYGFLSVCVLEVVQMGVAGTPRWLRFDNREFLYRLAVRLHGEPTFLTLRSDVSSRAMAALGRRFSHYRPHLADVTLEREPSRLRFTATSADGSANAHVDTSLEPTAPPPDSLFGSAQGASDFLLGMPFSADQAPNGRVRVQYIEHDPWNAWLVTPQRHEFEPLRRLEQQLGTRFEYDNTLAVKGIRQQWKAARWL